MIDWFLSVMKHLFRAKDHFPEYTEGERPNLTPQQQSKDSRFELMISQSRGKAFLATYETDMGSSIERTRVRRKAFASILVSFPLLSNETQESDAQHEKHSEHRLTTFCGIATDSRPDP
jgi:hypothetical protein